MGQKIHPGGMRVGVIHDWKSNWYTGKKEFPQYLIEDIRIRDHIQGKLAHAGISDILIRKDKQRITVDIYTARPGIVIGKSGVEVDALRKELHAITQKNVHININEIKRPELDAKLVAQSIAEQLQNRVSFRRAMKRSLASAMRSGARGHPIQCGGRLGGGEMCALRELLGGPRPAAHDPRGHRLRLRRGEDDVRPDRRQGLDQQGRDHARGLRGEHRRQGAAARRAGHAPSPRRRHRGPRRLARGRPRPQRDREGLGPVRQRRRPGGGPGGAKTGAARGRGGSGSRPRSRTAQAGQRRAPEDRRAGRVERRVASEPPARSRRLRDDADDRRPRRPTKTKAEKAQAEEADEARAPRKKKG